MMDQDRMALNIPDFEEPTDTLDDFLPRPGEGQEDKIAARAIDAVSSFPSREASQDGQLNLKGPRSILERFKVMCKADRRAYYDMLEILMDTYEGKR